MIRRAKLGISLAATALIGIAAAGLIAACGKSESVAVKEGVLSVGKLPDKAGKDGWTKFKERVTITVPVYDRSKEGYPAVDNNYWTQWVQKEFGDKYNIEVKYVAIPRGDVMTKYSLLIAAGDTPTILMEYDYPKVTQWANDGAMAEISLDEFAKIAPNYHGKMVANHQLAYTDVNGKTYFVLSERPYYNTAYSYATFVRMDWLRKVGYDRVPVSYAEHVDAVKKIMAARLTDRPPLNLSLPTSAYITNFAFHDDPVGEREWAMHSSLGIPCFAWEPTKRYLKRLNAEYNMGFYSKEYEFDADGSAGNSSTQQKTDFINGKLYRYSGYMSANVDWLAAFYKNNPNAELALESAYHIVEPGVVEHPINRADNPFGMIVGFSSKATPEQLKAAWMYMEWMLQDEVLFTMENGIEGVTYNKGPNGLPAMINVEGKGVKEMLNHNNNIDMTCVVHASKKLGTIEDTIKAIAPQNLPQDFAQALIDNYYEQKKIADNGWAYTDPVFAVAIKAESEYSATLLRLYQGYNVKLVKAEPAEFDALYAKFSEEYLKAGYQAIIDERAKAYDEGKTTKLPDFVQKKP
jgi:putative aldouronate transport system substrate-binding protein